jgi:hypothetical protein
MAAFELRIFEDRLGPEAQYAEPLAAFNQVIYVVKGTATIVTEQGSQARESNQAWQGADAVTVRAGDEGALVLRWDIVPATTNYAGIASGAGVASALKMASQLEIDPTAGYLMRCDRVDFPPCGVALTHTHQGPGTRCLLFGEFTVQTGGKTIHVDPLGAWFEIGPSPVYAEGSKTEPSAFVRVMVLPDRLKGQSSISYVHPEDKGKPKSQRYTVFLDEPIKI